MVFDDVIRSDSFNGGLFPFTVCLAVVDPGAAQLLVGHLVDALLQRNRLAVRGEEFQSVPHFLTFVDGGRNRLVVIIHFVEERLMIVISAIGHSLGLQDLASISLEGLNGLECE